MEYHFSHDKISEKNVAEAIESIMGIGIKIIVPIKSVIDRAVNLAFEFDITVYDACFIDLAELINFKFITADEKLYEKVKNLQYVKLLANTLK